MYTPISPIPTASHDAGVGTESPSTQHRACAAAAVSDADEEGVGQRRHSGSVMERAGAAVLAMSAGRTVSDQELRQHALDCAFLMEQAYARFEELHNLADRDEAVLWMQRSQEALRCLSPAWKAGREEQIQQDITRGQDYFVVAGESDRQKLGGATRA